MAKQNHGLGAWSKESGGTTGRFMNQGKVNAKVANKVGDDTGAQSMNRNNQGKSDAVVNNRVSGGGATLAGPASSVANRPKVMDLRVFDNAENPTDIGLNNNR